MYAASRRRPPYGFNFSAAATSSLALMADLGLTSSLPLPMDR